MSTFRRTHYVAIAKTVKEAATEQTPSVRSFAERLTYMLADYFAGENPLFDREKFLKEAGF